MAKVVLNAPITTDRYGLHFVNGEAHTNNEYLINKLIRKGVKVEVEQESLEIKSNVKVEKTIDEMTVAELKEYATKNNIEIPSNVKNKADIIGFITNYKEDDESNDPQTNDGEENSDVKSDNTDENLNTNLNNADDKYNNKKDDESKAE